MTYAERKYARLRHEIKHGDIILVRGRSWLPRIIEWVDKAYYSHALVVFAMGDRLMCIQSQSDGVQPAFLSQEIKANVDFCILSPRANIDKRDIAVERFFSKAQNGIPYDFKELPKILLSEKFGIKFKNIQGNPRQNICSVAAAITYGEAYPLTCYRDEFKRKGYITPQDLIRFRGDKQIGLIGHNPNF